MAISNIIRGWTNFTLDFFDALHPVIKQEGEKRLSICTDCPMRQGNTCSKNLKGINIETKEEVNGCGCNLAAKTLDPNSNCPLSKWKEYKL